MCILPIVEIEVLPARHFVPADGGGYMEISEDDIPTRTGPETSQLIAETVANLQPKSGGPVIPRRFTAREFEGSEGEYREYTVPEGYRRTENTWVHPPTLETGDIAVDRPVNLRPASLIQDSVAPRKQTSQEQRRAKQLQSPGASRPPAIPSRKIHITNSLRGES